MRFRLQPHCSVTWLIFLAVTGTYLVLALYFPRAYVFATYEDLIGEWTQAFGFLVTFILCVAIVRSTAPYRWFFLLLAFASLYTFLEEISWGQRVIGFGTPALLETHNLQGEANIHNLLVGPAATTTKKAIEWVLAGALVCYGFMFPLLLRFDWRVAAALDRTGLPAPSLCLAPFFLVAAVLELGLFHFNEAEIAELLVAFALALLASCHLYVRRHGLDPRASDRWGRGHSCRLAFRMMATISCVLALAAGATYAEYQSPGMRKAIESRLSNGYEKFAARYAGYGRWDTAAMLYIAVQETRGTEHSYYLHKIAECFSKMGNEVLAGIYTRKAGIAAANEYARGPRTVAEHLTLARVYQRRGKEEAANRYIERALDIAQDAVARNPDSASAAYWLGEAYHLIGDDKAALDQYRKAVGLDPASKTYRDAMQRSGRGFH